MSHGRVAYTLLIVMGLVVWIGGGFVVLRIPTATLAAFGLVGGLVGTIVARSLRSDVRRTESIAAAALAVAIVAGLTDARRGLDVDGAGLATVAACAVLGGVGAWIGYGVRASGRWLVVVGAGAAGLAGFVIALVVAGSALAAGGYPVVLGVVVLLLSPVIAGCVAQAVVPGCDPGASALGSLLVVMSTSLLAGIAAGEPGAVFVGWVLAAFGMAPAAFGAWLYQRVQDGRRPDPPDLPEARAL